MQVANALKTIEKNVEKELLTFFQLLGASEAPEEWHTNQCIAEKGHFKDKDSTSH